jgi:hypothetical protein
MSPADGALRSPPPLQATARQEASVRRNETRIAAPLIKAVETRSFTMTPPCGPKILILGCPQAAPYKMRAFDRQTKRSVPKLGGRHTQHPGDGMGFGLQQAAKRGAK